jgi:hypothetical protein
LSLSRLAQQEQGSPATWSVDRSPYEFVHRKTKPIFGRRSRFVLDGRVLSWMRRNCRKRARFAVDGRLPPQTSSNRAGCPRFAANRRNSRQTKRTRYVPDRLALPWMRPFCSEQTRIAANELVSSSIRPLQGSTAWKIGLSLRGRLRLLLVRAGGTPALRAMARRPFGALVRSPGFQPSSNPGPLGPREAARECCFWGLLRPFRPRAFGGLFEPRASAFGLGPGLNLPTLRAGLCRPSVFDVEQ